MPSSGQLQLEVGVKTGGEMPEIFTRWHHPLASPFAREGVLMALHANVFYARGSAISIATALHSLGAGGLSQLTR